jgi:hypothetical protein
MDIIKRLKLGRNMPLHRLITQFAVLTFVFYAGLFAAGIVGMKLAVAGQDSPHSSDDLLVSYQELLNSSGAADEGASIRIYQNGYTHIFYPKYMKQAGSYGVYLNDEALQKIWDLLISSNLLAFDEAFVRNEILRERKLRMESLSALSSVSDTSEIRLEVYPNRYQSIGFGSGDRNEFKKIAWIGLSWDAKQFPQNDMLQSLKMFQAHLQSVMTQPDLKRLD